MFSLKHLLPLVVIFTLCNQASCQFFWGSQNWWTNLFGGQPAEVRGDAACNSKATCYPALSAYCPLRNGTGPNPCPEGTICCSNSNRAYEACCFPASLGRK